VSSAPPLESAVENGAKWLDGIDPDWASRVDLDRLELGCTRWCVLAQLYGNPTEPGKADQFGRAATAKRLNEKKLGKRGFDLRDLDEEEGRTYGELTQIWRSEIEKRR